LSNRHEPATWRIGLEVPTRDHADPIGEALCQDGEPVTITEIAPGAGWRLEAYCATAPDRAALTARLGRAAASCGIAPPKFIVELLPEVNWVRRVQENSPPVTAGRFYIHGSHVRKPVPDGLIGIQIDAGAAFGTGTHETTRGCLMALGAISERRKIASALDLGCGSGVLAIGMAKLWPARVLASDNDPVAVEVSARNAEINDVSDRIRALCSDGFRHPAIRAAAPFELIAANILAQPLIGMAPVIARHMAAGGDVVLSGLLDSQSDEVVAAYARAGLGLSEKIVLGEWHALVMHRP
jgi:ribosomal protein L11 methyltransferase